VKPRLLFLSILFIATACRKSNTTPTPVATLDTLNSWVKIPMPAANVEDIWFMNQNNGIAVVDESGLYSSLDGGKTWNLIPNTSSVAAFNLQFVDSLNGFAQGTFIWATSDGGITWTKKSSTNGANYFQFINTTAGFYFYQATGIFTTHDGGNTWADIFEPATPGLSAKYPFYFMDSLKGYSMMNGDFYTTFDGGVNWNQKGSVTTKAFTGYYKMQFLDTLTGFSGTPDGLLKTTNGGKNWVNCFKSTNTDFDFQIPRFFDRNNGYFMTNNGIYKTTDGGQSWTTSCRIATGNTFSSIFFLNMNTGWATTYNGYILTLKQ
jgi:photosystem II stability/assembly factor-like uncharacterized protein